MKLRSLEAFCAAVEEGTISGAARRMYLSQPSVSDRLAELDREARIPLLARSRQGVKPTEEGMILYEHARRTLDDIRALERLLHGLRERRDMTLRFAASSTLGEHLLPDWLGDFGRRMPGAKSDLFVGNTQEVVDMVSRGEVVFGVIEGEDGRDQVEVLPLLDDELVVVVAPNHRWARQRVTKEDLSDEPFISRERGSGTRQVIENALANIGVSLNVQMEIGSTSAIKEAIEAGLGFSILSRETIRLEVESGHLATAEGFVIPRRFSIVRHPSANMSVVEQSFYDYLLGVRERYGKGPRNETG
ncbi:Transcriptional regulator [Rubrobacter radiotolerans]|uniref:Transcriptional regulator n=1 Tax=Rubrobacter radiotolerans TaxID=42256 RepID=A0A023X4A8_RUBRA|nr:LysR family transcriptional regulator [Rubrobacter radiotolerans]AHY47307.1 Transcriptional regulator [Rubrobacter radiotolerans]MDX5894711.1 LysR family transcriptional regulator [Rubrobacter radiotolerans]SMC06584.1 DNA-binding transcriptional regulator, LysR family [Rubrobacter radiotolerans DSM 5868]